jgi:hypothetical protein
MKVENWQKNRLKRENVPDLFNLSCELIFYSTSAFFQIKSVNLLLTNSLENELMIKDPMGSSISQS